MKINFIRTMLFMFLMTGSFVVAQNEIAPYFEFRGKIIDRQTNVPLTYCSVLVSGLNMTTVTNSEGEFSIKLPPERDNYQLVIRHIGYKSRSVGMKELNAQNGVVLMEQVTVQLPQIDVLTGDAAFLVRLMFDKVSENYPQHDMFMTAFYRESIRKRESLCFFVGSRR